ncbi:hypothetical protein GLOTRDRAFT_137587 [Gloeophyllum trabeum ATCC 11539]|uniref:Mmc1 C-terminal domain-containing protein n=1 Tax=Gloeophyllum trabeum (strain ATCC 11539 / FP-39264 / Madison 617) TaxID=670483 RepID=S7RRD4_GLOTA|nr:uncharacterized protein GLOTRDRAFT_137587 [Gloeophyllum trabeum ATCC 11539]EPQ57200.1 hypothetical protein GLOTRDRAFT_137587 [Gloeophyllum trabeum ATCC 11539]
MSSCFASALTAGPSRTQKLSPRSVLAFSRKRLSVPAGVLPHPRGGGAARRASTRSVPRAAASSPSSDVHKTLTALHKTRNFAEDVLRSRYRADLWDVWKGLLEQAHEDLSALRSEAPEGRKARVLVYGCDEFSGSADILTALLEDPISSGGAQNDTVRRRWQARGDQGRPESVEIEAGLSNSITEDKSTRNISLLSSWLQQFSTPLRVTELAPLVPPKPFPAPSLYSADVPVIVCDPLTTDLESLVSLELPVPLSPNAIVIFITPSHDAKLHAHITSYISQTQHERLHPSAFSTVPEAEGESVGSVQTRVLFIDPARALNAVRTLQGNSSSPRNVQKYQDDFVGSNISAFTDALKQITAPSSPSDTPLTRLRTQTAHTIAQGALQACRTVLWLEEDEIAALEAELGDLREQVAVVKDALPREVLSVTDESGDEVVRALRDAETALREVMGKLTWWRAAWRVDEIGQIVAAALERNWCKRLEDRLIYHAGRLTALQESMKTATDAILAVHEHPSPFDSPVLRNTLAQISSSPSYHIDAHVLTAPLTNRLAQIMAYPTPRLHLSAQRMVVGLSGSVVGGAGLGAAGWVGYVSLGPLGWMLGTSTLEPATAAGLGLLVAVVGVRWAVGRWEKAKRVWWKDWARVGEGLDRDLRAQLDRTIRVQVVAVPERACDELEAMIGKRKADLTRNLEGLQDLREELQSM